MTQQIADTFITSDGPTSGAVVYGYLASRFTTPPVLNSMPPGSYGADAGPVTTGSEWGGPGEFRMDLPTNEPYYLSFTYNGQVSWKFYGAALLTVGGRGVITLSANLAGNDKRATGFHDAVFPTDLATLAQVQLAQGTQGPQGSQGAQGDPSTVPGPQGFQGNQGFQGSAGPQGTQGFQGFQGFQGTQGNQGFQGNTGAGTQGAQGFQGTQGSQGDGYNITSPDTVTTVLPSPVWGVTLNFSNTQAYQVNDYVIATSQSGGYQVTFQGIVATKSSTQLGIGVTENPSTIGETRTGWLLSLAGQTGDAGPQGAAGAQGSPGAGTVLQPDPSWQNFLAWTFDPIHITTTPVYGSQNVLWAKVFLVGGTTISKAKVNCSGLPYLDVGIYDQTTLLASGNYTGSNVVNVTVPISFVAPSDGFYWVGFWTSYAGTHWFASCPLTSVIYINTTGIIANSLGDVRVAKTTSTVAALPTTLVGLSKSSFTGIPWVGLA